MQARFEIPSAWHPPNKVPGYIAIKSHLGQFYAARLIRQNSWTKVKKTIIGK